MKTCQLKKQQQFIQSSEKTVFVRRQFPYCPSPITEPGEGAEEINCALSLTILSQTMARHARSVYRPARPCFTESNIELIYQNNQLTRHTHSQCIRISYAICLYNNNNDDNNNNLSQNNSNLTLKISQLFPYFSPDLPFLWFHCLFLRISQ